MDAALWGRLVQDFVYALKLDSPPSCILLAVAGAPFFPTVDKIKYEGPESFNSLAFKHYNPDEVVAGKTMKDWLRFSVVYVCIDEGTRIHTHSTPPPLSLRRCTGTRCCSCCCVVCIRVVAGAFCLLSGAPWPRS
jgi:hypothetical protein